MFANEETPDETCRSTGDCPQRATSNSRPMQFTLKSLFVGMTLLGLSVSPLSIAGPVAVPLSLVVFLASTVWWFWYFGNSDDFDFVVIVLLVYLMLLLPLTMNTATPLEKSRAPTQDSIQDGDADLLE